MNYETVTYRKTNDPVKPAVTITKSVDLIKPDASYHGSVLLFVEFAKDAKKTPLAKQVEISVNGADLMQAQFAEKGKAKLPLTSELGKVVLLTDGTLELQFQNLDRSKKVVVKSLTKDKEDKPFGGDHPDVTLDVSDAAGK